MTAKRGVIQTHGKLNIEQCVHASLILLLPTVAALTAIVQIVTQSVTAWEIAACCAMYCATMIGITVGFHRMLAHLSVQPKRWLQMLLAVAGCMAAQGPPIYWASNHRRHHAYSDSDGDPHSPHANGNLELTGLRGFLHAHVGWTFSHALTNTVVFSKDLLQDRGLGMINRTYYGWVLLGLLLPGLAGWVLGGTVESALRAALWGGGVRLFFSYHFTSSINSVTHLSGSRRFETHENSRNNIWLALPTFGEAWHNNHHANPNAAKFGCTWWEVDIGWWVIALLQRAGLATGGSASERTAGRSACRNEVVGVG